MRLLLQLHQQVPEDKITQRHLAAFTARFTTSVVYKVKQELEQLNRLTDDAHTFFKDLFQLALEPTLNPTEFYENFEVDRTEGPYWFPSLKSYIRRRLEGLLCDKIRTMPGFRTYRRTDLGLATRASTKQTTRALEFQGFKDPQLAQYLLLWKCWQDLRPAPGEAAPSQTEQFIAVAQRYNQLRGQLHSAADSNPALNAPTAEKWLKQIGGAIRRYVDRPITSLDISLTSEADEQSPSRLDQLVDPLNLPEGEQLAPDLIQAETQAIKVFLDNLCHGLDPEGDRIPLLIHGLSLVQARIGIELDKSQTTIGRQYRRILTQFVTQLANWALVRQGLTLDSETLSAMKALLIEQFDDHYTALMDRYFSQHFSPLQEPEQELLRLFYLCAEEIPQIAQTLNIPDEQLRATLLATTQQLQNQVQAEIEQRLQLSFKPQGPVQERLVPLTETWLQTAPYPH
jgi:hypothetical protein